MICNAVLAAGAICTVSAVVIAAESSSTPAGSPLVLEAEIPLGNIRGRIDHLAIDVARRRLFVAELGNNSVGVLDLEKGSLVNRLSGLAEPQGIAFVADTDEIYVANGADGTVHRYGAGLLDRKDTIRVGNDADNVRVDARSHTVLVGYDAGALAVIDLAGNVPMRSIALNAHPESFQLESDGRRVYVNLPDARAIAIVDLATSGVVAQWPTADLRANYPMALEPSGQRVWVGFRRPARLVAFDTQTGTVSRSVPICGDTDDVFFDERRSRIYVVCGSGDIDVLDYTDTTVIPDVRIATRSGARTGLFVPQLDRLYVAAPAAGGKPAVILVYRPETSL